MKLYPLGFPGVLLVLSALGAATLPASGGADARIGESGAMPAYVVVNTPALVTFTASLSDSTLERHERERVLLVRIDANGELIDIVGRMRDNGRNGDVDSRDSVYSLQVLMNEPRVGPIHFRVAARFTSGSGVGRRDASDEDDWDRELHTLNDPQARNTRRDRLPPLLRRLKRYTLSGPIQVTVDPFTLPPDPGEAGKQTLEGVDTDRDGVRDDVQRYLAYGTGTDASAIAALSQRARALQLFVAVPLTEASALEAYAVVERAAACLDHRGISSNVRRSLESAQFNTEARTHRLLELGRVLSGRGFDLTPLDRLAQSCDGSDQ